MSRKTNPKRSGRKRDRRAERARGPIRTCRGCGRRAPRDELIRFVRPAGPGPIVGAFLPGRGFYVCPEPACVDRLVAGGGSAMFSETTEAIGAAHLLARRAVNDRVAEEILQTVKRAEERMKPLLAPGEHFLTTGNMDGGLTTLEEKSLGCISKTGSAPITEVVPYGQKPQRKGLVLVDGTGFDVPSMTGMVAAGAQIVAFTTGKGSPVGYPIVPVIKITGNPNTYRRLEEIIDLSAATITEGTQEIGEVGEAIFRELLAVAGGRTTRAEAFGFCDFSIATLAGAYAGV